MLLYTEKQLDRAYRIDCKARTRNNSPWIKREKFRDLYEDLMEDNNGSSPRVRGTSDAPNSPHGITRFIPACAGNIKCLQH